MPGLSLTPNKVTFASLSVEEIPVIILLFIIFFFIIVVLIWVLHSKQNI